MLTQLINARILTPQGWLKDGSVLIRDGKILEVTNCDLAVIGAQLIDVKGMYVLPGGVEIHAHGGGGRDFMECTEDAFRAAVKTHMKYGTTSIFPTLSSSTVPMILSVIGTVGTRILWIFGIFPDHRTLYVLFISYPGSWIITIIMQVICYYFVRKKTYAKAATKAV